MRAGQNHHIQAFFILIGGLLFMSLSAIIIKTSNAPGIITALYRMGIGTAILLIPFLYHLLKNKPNISRKGIMLAIFAGLCFGLDLSFWSTGVVASNATIPTLFANLAPFWVGIGTMLIFKEKHSRGFWIGLTLALLGIPLLLFHDIYQANGVVKGAILGLIAGFFYGAFYLFTQPGRKLLDTLSFLFISTLSSTLVLFIIALVLRYEFIGYDQHTWLMFLSIGVGVQVIGWLLINYAQGYLPASIVAPTLLGQPLITAVIATIMLDEELSCYHISGGIVIIAGIYIVHYSRYK